MKARKAIRPKNQILECHLLYRSLQYARNPAAVTKTLRAKLRQNLEGISAELDAFGAAHRFALD